MIKQYYLSYVIIDDLTLSFAYEYLISDQLYFCSDSFFCIAEMNEFMIKSGVPT